MKKFGRNQKRKLKLEAKNALNLAELYMRKYEDIEYFRYRHHNQLISVTLEIARLVKDMPGDRIAVVCNTVTFKMFRDRLGELDLLTKYDKAGRIHCGEVVYVPIPNNQSAIHRLVGVNWARCISLVGPIMDQTLHEMLMCYLRRNQTIHEVNV